MTLPHIEQNDAAWLYRDHETKGYILECWICDIQTIFDGDPAPDRSTPYAPKYLVDTVNSHNQKWHSGKRHE